MKYIKYMKFHQLTWTDGGQFYANDFSDQLIMYKWTEY